MTSHVLAKTVLAILICSGSTDIMADWSEGRDNRALNPGPWREGYIPTPPPGESYRKNATMMEAISAGSGRVAFLVWVWKVRSGGVWDYKKDGTSATEFRRLEAAGNFSYGVTAAAQGMPYEYAQFLAGIEHMYGILQRNFTLDRIYGGGFALGAYGLRGELPTWNWISPVIEGRSAYFDDPRDAVSIKAGYDWYMRTQQVPRPAEPTSPRLGDGDTVRSRDGIDLRFDRWDRSLRERSREAALDPINPYRIPDKEDEKTKKQREDKKNAQDQREKKERDEKDKREKEEEGAPLHRMR